MKDYREADTGRHVFTLDQDEVRRAIIEFIDRHAECGYGDGAFSTPYAASAIVDDGRTTFVMDPLNRHFLVVKLDEEHMA